MKSAEAKNSKISEIDAIRMISSFNLFYVSIQKSFSNYFVQTKELGI
jgi:hypothetical protein